MKLKYQNKRKLRKGFLCISIEDNIDLWWSKIDKKWMTINDIITNNQEIFDFGSQLWNCKSIKKFKRHARKHKKVLKGLTLRLHHKILGNDVFLKVK